MHQTSPQFRSLAIALSSRGFGYAVMEGKQTLIAYGNTVINQDKNIRSLVHIEKLITRYQPDVLVLQAVNAKGTHRAPRIKALHRKVITLVTNNKLKTVTISGKELRTALLGNEAGTKQEMAELLAKKFPAELASRLPPKRKSWQSEDARMDTFEAVALSLTVCKNEWKN
jgi:Holliday junction resolvasome RuvABC endonuclease subunit